MKESKTNKREQNEQKSKMDVIEIIQEEKR